MLGSVLNVKGHYSEAETLARKALQDVSESDYFSTEDEILSVLGGSLAGQKRYKEAEPILVKHLNNLFENPAASTEDRQEAVEQIIQFYVDWDKPGEAVVWKKKLSSFENNASVFSPE